MEDTILEALSRGETAGQVLERERSWPALYHLSDVRRNLLEWFPFDSNARLLEIGAGCGALTGLFCERTHAVTALELSRKRAEIIRVRHAAQANLTVAVGNVRNLPVAERFDAATLIGVLEYAGAFTPAPDPGAYLLELVARQLAPGGTLILAIENRFGLKYWAGAPEDHTGIPFEGLEGYLQRRSVRTYSRPELEQVLQRAGFGDVRFFYPMPDYKLPEHIFSDERPPQAGEVALRFPNWDRERLRLFDERAVLDGITGSGAFPFFANSFLVVARREGDPAARNELPESVLYARYSRSRLSQYRIETRIAETTEGTVVKKRALEFAGRAHIANIVTHHQALQGLDGPLRVPAAKLCDGVAEVSYVAGTSLEVLLMDALLRHNTKQALDTVGLFAELVRSIAVPPEEAEVYGDDGSRTLALPSGILDANLDNFIRDARSVWWLIDVEWRWPEPVCADFVIARALEYFILKRHDLVAGVLAPQELFDRVQIDAARRRTFQAREHGFQLLVRGAELVECIDTAFERPSRTLDDLEQERQMLAAALSAELDAQRALENLERERQILAAALSAELDARRSLEADLHRERQEAADAIQTERSVRRALELDLTRRADDDREARAHAEERARSIAMCVEQIKELGDSLRARGATASALEAALAECKSETDEIRKLAAEREREAARRVAALTDAVTCAERSCEEMQAELDRMRLSGTWRLASQYHAAWRRIRGR